MPRFPSLILLTLLGALLAAGISAALAGASVAEYGTLLRDSALVANPGGAEMRRLAAGTTVEVHGRQGLWLLVTAPGADAGTRGWTRLTAVRLGGAAGAAGASTANAPSESGFARFSRSITGLLGGLRGRETRTGRSTTGRPPRRAARCPGSRRREWS